jgi:hypothetical protein
VIADAADAEGSDASSVLLLLLLLLPIPRCFDEDAPFPLLLLLLPPRILRQNEGMSRALVGCS